MEREMALRPHQYELNTSSKFVDGTKLYDGQVLTNQAVRDLKLCKCPVARPVKIEGVDICRKCRGKWIGTLGTIRIKDRVGRNDPCLCGSGVKYKKCCGK